MSKWTKEKIKKQINVGYFYNYSTDKELRIIRHLDGDTCNSINIKHGDKYNNIHISLLLSARFFKDYECTMEILPEPIKVKKMVRFYRYIANGKLSENWYAVDAGLFTTNFREFEELTRVNAQHLIGCDIKTSLYVELEVEVEE